VLLPDAGSGCWGTGHEEEEGAFTRREMAESSKGSGTRRKQTLNTVWLLTQNSLCVEALWTKRWWCWSAVPALVLNCSSVSCGEYMDALVKTYALDWSSKS